MSSATFEPARRRFGVSPRYFALALGLVTAMATFAFAFRLLPPGFAGSALAIASGVGALAVVGALTSTEADLQLLVRAYGIASAILMAAAASGLGGAKLEPVFALGALGLAGFLTWRTAAANRAPALRLSRPLVLLAIATASALVAYNAWYVLASKDLEIADFMYFRLVSIAVASLIDSGRVAQLVFETASSLKSDYSWLPGLAPGVVLAATAPLSRAAYQVALMVFYGAPALIALGWLARELAARAGFTSRRSVFALALGVAAAAAAYPTSLAVTARGMPDVGGLILYVYALRTGEKFCRAAALPRASALIRRLALTLALTFFAMFIFRRWYAFAALGVAAAMALELGALAAPRWKTLPWRSLLNAGALAGLFGAALLSPILVDWAGDPAKHDYVSAYAAYRKPLDVFFGLVGDWWGFGVLALAAFAFAFLILRSREARLARMTLMAGAVAAALFLRIQTPYVHHVFLIAPFAAAIAALVIAAAARARAAGFAALAVLSAFTLTPAGALAPKGVFPTYGRPHAPRTDLAELARMKNWVDQHASPDEKVCGLGSSYTFSGQLIDELWQLKADRSPLQFDKRKRTSVMMNDVDTVEGAPTPELKDCAYMLVGDPVQTHLIPAYQQTVVLPSKEMLEGSGIGAHYARTGEEFRLENGVTAVVFRRTVPLTDQDMADLADRWRLARESKAP